MHQSIVCPKWGRGVPGIPMKFETRQNFDNFSNVAVKYYGTWYDLHKFKKYKNKYCYHRINYIHEYFNNSYSIQDSGVFFLPQQCTIFDKEFGIAVFTLNLQEDIKPCGRNHCM